MDEGTFWDEEPDELDAFIEEASSRSKSFAADYEDARHRHELLRCLIERRKQGGLTQTNVADRMGTTQSAVSDLERGESDPFLSTLQRFARAVDAKLDLLLRDPDPDLMSFVAISSFSVVVFDDKRSDSRSARETKWETGYERVSERVKI